MESARKPARFSWPVHISARVFVSANTMTRLLPRCWSTRRSSAGFFIGPTGIMNWSMVSAVSPLWDTSTNAGSFKMEDTLCMTLRSSVAENSSVWREEGVAATTFFMVGQKPMSSMRSASSSTSTSTSRSLTTPRSMRSYSLPGVATRTSMPRSSFAICPLYFVPPITVSMRRFDAFASCVQAASICWVSSRVGLTTSARGDPGRLARPMRSNRGSANAAVLPVPVVAAATTSRPSRTNGIACSCTGVGAVKPIRSTADRVVSDRPRS